MPIKRPLTPQELAQLVADGYDMSSYHGEPIERSEAPAEGPSLLGVATRSAAASAVPTLAGGAGFGLAMGALAPETMGASLLAIPIAAGVGYLSSRLAGKAQQEIIPESWSQQIAAESQSNPYASAAGQLATLPLGGFNPSPANTIRAAGAIPQMLAGRVSQGTALAASQAGRQALMNVGGGAVIGGIQEAAMQPLEGREFSLGDIAKSAAVGGLFNQPNRIGQFYGFHPTMPSELANANKLRAAAATTPGAGIKESTDIVRPAGARISNIGTVQENAGFSGQPGIWKGKTYLPAKKAEESATYMDMLLRGNAPVESRANVTVPGIEGPVKEPGIPWTTGEQTPYKMTGEVKDQTRKQDYIKSIAEEIQVSVEAQQAAGAESRPGAYKTKSGETAYKGANKVVGPEQVGITPEESAADLESRRLEGLGDRYQPEYNLEQEHRNALDEHARLLKIKHDLEDRYEANKSSMSYKEVHDAANREYAAAEKVFKLQRAIRQNPDRNQPESSTSALEQEVRPGPLTDEFHTIMTRNLATPRKITTEMVDSLFNSNGDPVRGTAQPSKGNILLKKPTAEGGGARLDTDAHEIGHFVRLQLERAAASGDTRASDTLAKWDAASKPELDSINAARAKEGKGPIDAHEFSVAQQGLEFLKQQMNMKGEKPFRKWLEDTKALLKTRWMEKPDVESVRRAMNFRMVNDPSLGRYEASGMKGMGDVSSKQQLDNPEQAAWRIANNKVATGSQSQEYKLPEGFNYGTLWERSINAPKQEIIDLYNQLVKLNPELANIKTELEYKGNHYPEKDIVKGVASKFKSDNIKYFVEDLKGTLQTNPSARIRQEGTTQITRNQSEDYQLRSDKQRYDEIQTQLRQILSEGKDLDSMQELWKESEQIKNRNGGMPPKGEFNQSEEDTITSVFINAAKRTDPYLEWVKRNSADTSDAAFVVALEKSQAMQEDFRSEPDVQIALQAFSDKQKELAIEKGKDEKVAAKTATPSTSPKTTAAPKAPLLKTILPPHHDIIQSRPGTAGKVEGVPDPLPRFWNTPISEIGKQVDAITTAEEARNLVRNLDIDFQEMSAAKDNAQYKPNLRDKLASRATANRLLRNELESKYGLAGSEDRFQPEEQPGEGKLPEGVFTNKEYNRGEKVRSDLMEEGRQAYIQDLEQGATTAGSLATNRKLRQAISLTGIDFPSENMRNQSEEQTGQQPLDIETLPHSAFGLGNWRPFEGTFDRVARTVNATLGNAFHRWRARMDNYSGLGNVALKELGNYSRESVNNVSEKMNQAYRSYDKLSLSPDEQPIYNAISGYYQAIRAEQIKEGLTIEGRTAGENPNYVPHQLNDTTLDLFTRRVTSPEAKSAYNQWVDYVMRESKGKLKEEDVKKNISAYIKALGSPSSNYKEVNFGALRKVAGYGLPDALRETDAIRSLSKYSNRAARDLAMFTELEKKPDIANLLELRNPLTGEFHTGAKPDELGLSSDEAVRNAMKWVTGNWSGTTTRVSQQVNALGRLVNSMLLGPATSIRNVAQIPNVMLPYLSSSKDLAAVVNGVRLMRENSADALRSAATRPQIDKMEFNELASAPDKFTSAAQTVATFLRKWQGSEAIENLSRDLTFSIGKELAKSNILAAQSGNVKAKSFLDKFGLLVDGDITTLKGPELETALNQMAKNFTDRNQGTYSGSGLPAWVQDSKFAPFFALQKWSIEKSNVIKQDVVNPFMSGENRLPMITYVLGSVLTGVAIQKLNELLTNRKGQDPTWQEALDQPTAKNIISEMTTLMQLASFGGIVGDGLKTITDVGLQGKAPRNIVSFPTATAAINFEEKTKWMLEALRQGENPWDVFKNYSIDLMVQQVQAARLLANHTIKEQDAERSDKFRDVRTFNELQGKPAGEMGKTNPYLGIDEKQFNRTENPSEAAAMLPALLKKKMTQSGGDYEKLSKSLSGLSRNSYQTFPSMETPQAFQNYYQFLLRTQGKAEADKRMLDYMQHSMVNKMKGGMVPRL